MSAWLPLQTAAGAFRDECSTLEQLVHELFADIGLLGRELEAKADELEDGRRHLAERGRQLAEQRKESAKLSHQLEQQETQLTEALAELRELRAGLAKVSEPVQIQGEISSLQTDALAADLLRGLSSQLGGEFAQLKESLATTPSNPSAGAELETFKQELLERLDRQFTAAATELQQLRAEFSQRAEMPLPQESSALDFLAGQVTQQFSALEERIRSLQQESPEAAELDSLKKERLELELELELVRARSTELQETVTRQKRDLAAQQLQVSDELKELRSLIAEQGELMAQHEPPVKEPVAARESAKRQHTVTIPQAASDPIPPPEDPAKPQDPVVNSVMAQFAKLQRDIAQRRKKK